jgi:7-cyano-7-deazaguanine synthase in queuosine biosynthesis
MKIKPVVLYTNPSDTFEPAISNEGKLVVVDLTEQARKSSLLRHKVYKLIDQSKLSEDVQDLLNLSLMAYTVDQTVSREANGYLNWSRHFKCYVPVANPDKWDSVKGLLQEMFSFLSGDKWEFVFRSGLPESAKLISKTYNLPDSITKVCLFSGGLDSFIGALDLLHHGENVALISHYKAGGVERKAQHELVNLLQSEYNKQLAINYPFYVQPNQSLKDAEKEISSRARSLLFIGLGIAVASCLGNIPLIIPENGFISLNVPLTFTRHGSHSTRTTHPYFLYLFQQILDSLDIHIRLDNPYQFKTKGEMVAECENPALLKGHFRTTLSCAHPDQARFQKLPPGTHCGYCTPCIIRRASLEWNDLRDDLYVKDIKSTHISPVNDSGRDPRAFRLALERYRTMNPKHTLIHIMNSGPLSHFSKQELIDLTRMYRQGMKEVEEVLPRYESLS